MLVFLINKQLPVIVIRSSYVTDKGDIDVIVGTLHAVNTIDNVELVSFLWQLLASKLWPGQFEFGFEDWTPLIWFNAFNIIIYLLANYYGKIIVLNKKSQITLKSIDGYIKVKGFFDGIHYIYYTSERKLLRIYKSWPVIECARWVKLIQIRTFKNYLWEKTETLLHYEYYIVSSFVKTTSRDRVPTRETVWCLWGSIFYLLHLIAYSVDKIWLSPRPLHPIAAIYG